MTVQVIDGETHQPLSGAKVEMGYTSMMDFTVPFPSTGVTDERGVVTLRVAEYDNNYLVASRDGYYLVGEEKLKPGFVSSLPWNDSGIKYVLTLWAGPAPTIELIVPNSYRGPIKARFQQEDQSTYPPGQRIFTYRTDNAGRVTVKGPQFLKDMNGYAKLVVRYENGDMIPSIHGSSTDGKSDETIAIREINASYHNQITRLLLIGTGSEADALYERTIHRLGPNHFSCDSEAYYRVFNE